jgi:TetR/AcrR family transcriptional regulator, transcriptional repressor for nem operon
MTFGQFRDWVRTQFEEPVQAQRTHELAPHLLARSQGIAIWPTPSATKPSSSAKWT